MKLTYLDDKSLCYKRISMLPLILALFTLSIAAILMSYSFGYDNGINDSIKHFEPTVGQIAFTDIEEEEEFSQEILAEAIIETNIKFPHIVMAQAILETGHFKSEVFAVNHNLFGMKQARIRPTTALGTNIGHAYYNDWKESVYDYALYQAAYLRKIKSEEQYFEYLGSNYAEAKHYVKSLKKVIKKNKLEELFEEG